MSSSRRRVTSTDATITSQSNKDGTFKCLQGGSDTSWTTVVGPQQKARQDFHPNSKRPWAQASDIGSQRQRREHNEAEGFPPSKCDKTGT